MIAKEPAPAHWDAKTDTRRNFYGRVHGKTLRPSQKAYLSEDMAHYLLSGVSTADNPPRDVILLTGALAPPRPLWLEIGFGGGEHLAHMASSNPDVGLIGCEPFVNGIAMLLGKLRTTPCPNLRLHPGDVRDLFDVLPDACIDKAFLNYPDPWPKSRHHRRRFVTPGYLHPLARTMKRGGEFRIASDIPDYIRQALEQVPQAGFRLVAQGGLGDAWGDWPSTRYEQKALREGRAPHYLTFLRD